MRPSNYVLLRFKSELLSIPALGQATTLTVGSKPLLWPRPSPREDLKSFLPRLSRRPPLRPRPHLNRPQLARPRPQLCLPRPQLCYQSSPPLSRHRHLSLSPLRCQPQPANRLYPLQVHASYRCPSSYKFTDQDLKMLPVYTRQRMI